MVSIDGRWFNDKDVGRAVALAVSHPAAAGRVFNVTDGGFHTLSEIIESICSALGRKPPRLSLPVGPTRLLIGLVEKGSRSIGLKPLVTPEMIENLKLITNLVHETHIRCNNRYIAADHFINSHPVDCGFGQADFQGTCVVLVGSGGDRQSDF
ncbi:MAG: hypothetical protein Q7J31_03460 [Syntrophales bacterium]|nr:hypothetical protein [Syntrophales bacterium]